MSPLNRREFIRSSALLAGTFAIAPARAGDANSEIRVAVVGVRGRGKSLIEDVIRTEGAKLVALCDVDSEILAERAAGVEAEHGVKVEQIGNYKEVLDRKDIDAVVLCTPNHWHALQTIWACQAGKDVYVEKPVCHSVWEGRQMVAAARQSGQIVQAGFQNRSDVALQECLPGVAAGEYGKVSLARGLCYRNRASIGKLDAKLQPPKSVDYDTWLGPAADEPMFREQFHYDWHWVWNTGNGDLGNQGPHELDLLRWALGDPPHPKKVYAFGERFAWNDAGETPNMAVASFDWGDVPTFFEVRNLWVKPDLNAAPAYKDRRVAIILNTEAGELRAGRGGAALYDESGKRIKAFNGDGGFGHFPAFVKAIRSRKESDLACPIDIGFHSSCLAHLGNISIRSSKEGDESSLEKKIAGNDRLLEIHDRYGEQLSAWEIDLKDRRWHVGRELQFDGDSETFTGDEAGKANKLLKRKGRKGFEIPAMASGKTLARTS